MDVDVHADGTVADEASEAEIEEPTVESLQVELEEQRQKADEHLNHLQRLQAEFNNYRRRMAQEKLQAAGRGKVELLSSLLPVLNNLRLALQHADQDPELVRQGVQMIWQQCEEFLRSQGVEPIPTVGQPFDPMKHEALSIAPATEETPANTVVAEINPGICSTDSSACRAGGGCSSSRARGCGSGRFRGRRRVRPRMLKPSIIGGNGILDDNPSS